MHAKSEELDIQKPASFLSALIEISILFLGVRARTVSLSGCVNKAVRRRAGMAMLYTLQGRNCLVFTLGALIFRQKFQRELPE